MRRFLTVFVLGLVATAFAAAAPSVPTLTDAERAWLAAHPVIRVGFDPDYRPFSFRDAAGIARGIDIDLLAVLASRLGVKFEVGTASTWSEVYDRAVRREFDLTSSTADNPERRKNFLFTREYVKFPATIVARTDGPFALTEGELVNLRVASVRNYAPSLNFRRMYPTASVRECDTIEEALSLVARGEADASLTNLTNASYIIKTAGLSNLKIAGVLPEFFELRFAVRNDWPELQGILDKALLSLPPTTMSTILDRWVRVDYAAVIRWDVVRRWAIIGLTFGLTVLGLVVWRNRSLSEELEKRRAVQRELEAANTRLNGANAELTHQHEEKSELMRVAAHDLRNPITAILLSADLLRLSGRPRSEWEKIQAGAAQMKKLVEDMLEVHALEEGRRVFKRENVDLAWTLQAAATAHEGVAQSKDLTFDTAGVQPVPAVIVDGSAVRQVFDNLISNALKFSPPGRRVILVARPWNEFVRIEVRDEGPGVPAAERERIFTKYARGTAQPTGGEKSTGLGLAIVRDLTSAMNGRVWCEDAPGVGAIFVVVFPAATGK